MNGNIMTTARITYAMGRDRIFWQGSEREHPRYQTPANALRLHAVWTMIVLLSLVPLIFWEICCVCELDCLWCRGGRDFLLRRRMP